MLILQIAAGVFLGGIALLAFYETWVALKNIPPDSWQQFWRRLSGALFIYIFIVGGLLIYIILGEYGYVTIW